ncbi:MAG: hypothetical protein Q4G07_02285 [Oscillospiraceae bacterium]|nr:hypothetical protein [Oscillospiraceae bacterium]
MAIPQVAALLPQKGHTVVLLAKDGPFAVFAKTALLPAAAFKKYGGKAAGGPGAAGKGANGGAAATKAYRETMPFIVEENHRQCRWFQSFRYTPKNIRTK